MTAEIKYNYLVSQAKKLFRGKAYPFTEYDIANEAFLLLRGDESLDETNKILRKCYSEEVREKENHCSFEERFVVKSKIQENEKLCISCKETYPISNFYLNVYRKSGYSFHSAYCLECARFKCREYRKKNKEKFYAIWKKSREKNKEKYKITRNKYYKSQSDNLTDSFIRKRIWQSIGYKIPVTSEMIIEKRNNIIRLREKREIRKMLNQKSIPECLK